MPRPAYHLFRVIMTAILIVMSVAELVAQPAPTMVPVQPATSQIRAPLRLAPASIVPSTSRTPLLAADIAPLSNVLPEATLAARRSGIVPGAFKGAVTELQPGVRIVSDATLQRLASSMRGSVVDAARFGDEAGGILVSSGQGVAVRLDRQESGELVAFRPDFSEVLKDFHIPDQEVPINAANILWLADGVSVETQRVPASKAMQPTGRNAPVSTRGAGPADSDAMVFTIDERVRTGFDDEGNGIEIRFGGSVELVAPSIYGKYTKFSGYRLVFKAGERVSLKTDAFVKLDKEIKVPIQAFEIPAGLGRARLGLYLIADLKGSMRLEVEIDQGFSLEAGVRGGTCFYIPTGIKEVYKLDRWFSLDTSFNGNLDGFIGVSAEAELSAFGYNLLDLSARAGLKALVTVVGNDMDIRAGMKLRIRGEVAGKGFSLVNKYIELLSEIRRQTGIYDIKVTDACAYRSLVRGSVVVPTGLDSSTPYSGPLSVRVRDQSGATIQTKTVQTDRKGAFILEKFQLRKGDIVEILVPESADNWVCPTPALFPFDGVDLAWADYLDDEVSGNIDGKIGTPSMILMPSAVPLTYSGPATVLVADINEVNGSDLFAEASRARRIPVEILGGDFTKRLPDGALTPDSIVGIEIAKNGFVLRSPVVRASGLTLAAIRSDGLELAFVEAAPGQSGNSRQSSPAGAGETWSADTSYVILAPVRSDTMPTGEVTLKGGMDLPHRALGDTRHVPVDYEKSLEANLANPLWFYRQTVRLERWIPPVSLTPAFGADKNQIASRAAVARTGAWTATISSNPAVKPEDIEGDRHFFESASYRYRGVELGYWSKQEFCRGFGSCDVTGLFGGNPYSRDAKIADMMRAVNLPSLNGIRGSRSGKSSYGSLANPGWAGGLEGSIELKR